MRACDYSFISAVEPKTKKGDIENKAQEGKRYSFFFDSSRKNKSDYMNFSLFVYTSLFLELVRSFYIGIHTLTLYNIIFTNISSYIKYEGLIINFRGGLNKIVL